MAFALPVLLEALWLHGLDMAIHTILPSHRRPEHVEAALARHQLLPLRAGGIQEQPKAPGINITQRHGPHFRAALGCHRGQEAHVYMRIVVLAALLDARR